MRLITSIAFICCASIAHSQTSIACNQNGAVVTASDGNVFYLGKSCDAAQKGGGTGKWWYAASAFIVQIDGKQGVRFSQEMICDVPYCKP